MALAVTNQPEFIMTDSDFEKVSEFAYIYTGLVFGTQKKDMIYSRLIMRLRALELYNIGEYLSLIDSEDKPEVAEFINALTTKQTSFFDNQHQFDFLSKTLCSEWVNTNSAFKKIRIWSAGCSTGEEPYSIAMTLLEKEGFNDWDCKILATELDPQKLEKGRQGIYDIDSIESSSLEKTKQWFLHDKHQPNVIKVKPELKEIVDFQRLNLLDNNWPINGSLDLIFCRSVIIYFNDLTQVVLCDRFAEMLKDGGYLIIGHSERLSNLSPRFKHIGKTIYQKVQ